MPVAAGVVGDGGVRAGVVLAARDMAPTGQARGLKAHERHRAAALDRAHHLQLVEADVSAVGFTPSGTVVAEDIHDLQSWPAHVGGAYAAGSGLCLFLGRWCVPPSCASGLSMAAIRPVAMLNELLARSSSKPRRPAKRHPAVMLRAPAGTGDRTRLAWTHSRSAWLQ